MSDPSKGKIRFVMVELEGSDATIQAGASRGIRHPDELEADLADED